MMTYTDYLEQVQTLITPEEAAKLLHVGMNTMYKILNSGKLKAYKQGRIWKIPKKSCEQYIRDMSNWSGVIW